MNDRDWLALTEKIVSCRKCPRLVEWREEVARQKRRAFVDWDYWGRPVPGFGDPNARLFVVGLAPGAHGSNRTGRMFTGDSSGETLFGALYRAGFANQPNSQSRNDSLELTDTFISAVVRCVPPANRPTGEEIKTCLPFLQREWTMMPQVKILLALGQIAFDRCLRALRHNGNDIPRIKFSHGLHYEIENTSSTNGIQHILASYHPSRQNTQTGRLTTAMFDDVFNTARTLLDY